jgi:hypothetical protein
LQVVAGSFESFFQYQLSENCLQLSAISENFLDQRKKNQDEKMSDLPENLR